MFSFITKTIVICLALLYLSQNIPMKQKKYIAKTAKNLYNLTIKQVPNIMSKMEKKDVKAKTVFRECKEGITEQIFDKRSFRKDN